jgi:predicted O-methyltransferase YrrM
VRRKLTGNVEDDWKVFISTVKRYSSNEGARLPHLRLAVPLYVLCKYRRPRVVVETGVAHGFSTFGILAALQENRVGELYSIDVLERMKLTGFAHDLWVDWLVPAHLRNRWHLVVGRSQDKLPSLLHELGEIDIFLHDSEHTTKLMRFEYETAYKHLRRGGIIMSDDADDPSAREAFLEFAE